tara:strand:+ start:1007 stop:1687 length:681 start_codon:yes stop_codon:yes gene_type:complete
MSLGFVYTGERRFESIGRENHKLLYNTLSEFTPFSIYDQCKADRKNDEFKLSAPNQIWDFYKALPAVKERIVVKMRTDIWLTKSSIPHIVNEILATQQGKRTFTLIGSELKTHYNNEYDTYDLPSDKSKVKTADFITIADKESLRPKDEIYELLKTEKSKSGNRLWQRIRKGPGKYSFGQIYLIRANYKPKHLNDNYMAYQFAEGYNKVKHKEALKFYNEHLSSNS